MALQNTFYFDVDLKQPTYIQEPRVTQNDEVTFVLRVFDDGVPFTLTDISTYTLVSQRKDKQSVQTVGMKTGDNEITFTLGTTELTVPGKVKAAIQLYDIGGRVSSIPFMYTVLDDLAEGYIPSVDDQTLIELVLGEGPAILNAAEAVTAEANTFLANNVRIGDYDITVAYVKGNEVGYDGSSYVALGPTQGNLPTDTTYWALRARKGLGDVNSVNGVLPDGNGNVTITIPDPDLSGLATKTELQERGVNVKSAPYNAIGDGVTDDTLAIQTAFDENSVVFIPEGDFLITTDLWLKSGSKIYGIGQSSNLIFTSTSRLRSEKGGQRGFDFVDNYNSDIIPTNAGDYTNLTLTSSASIGSNVLNVTDTSEVTVGDKIYTFNNDGSAWDVLVDSAQSEKWNDYINFPLAQMEIFTVLSKTSSTITLDRKTLFSLPFASPVKKIVGSSSIGVSDLQLSFIGGQQYGCVFEQLHDSTLENLTVNGGGIHLFNKCFNNIISNCHLSTTTERVITIDSFSSRNKVTGNIINYSHGGDSAIIVMMANGNVVSGNIVTGSGTQNIDEKGITIHARSYGNVVSDNVVQGSSSGYAIYFGAFNNVINGNQSISSQTHITCYFANKNLISNNITIGINRALAQYRGIQVFSCVDIDIIGNKFSAACYLQSSIRIKLLENEIVADDVGVIYLGDNTLSEHSILNNRIIAPIGVKLTTADYLVWDGCLPTQIEGNTFNCTTIGIDLNWLSYVNIRGNIFKNCADAIYLRDLAIFSTIQNNQFVSCVTGINFLGEAQSSYSSVKDNTFYKVTTPINGWVSPAGVFAQAGGIYGFKIYNLNDITGKTGWVYNSIATGLAGVDYWTVL